MNAAAILVWGPLLGTGERPLLRTAAAALGTALCLPAAGVAFGGGAPGAVTAGLALAGFLVLLSGLAASAARALGGGAAGVAVAAALGALFLASFHVGDPFLEWGGPGSPSRTAIGLLHLVNPASGAIGDGLELDWLRLPIMYSGFPGTAGGGLSSAQYYRFAYTPWWGTIALHGGLGALLLLAGGGRGTFRFPRDRGRT
ncbi:MAG: hypothetical protein ACYTDY_14975 [Planctomycetota bacterium]